MSRYSKDPTGAVCGLPHCRAAVLCLSLSLQVFQQGSCSRCLARVSLGLSGESIARVLLALFCKGIARVLLGLSSRGIVRVL